MRLDEYSDLLNDPCWQGSVFALRAGRTHEWLVALGVQREVLVDENTPLDILDPILHDGQWWFATLAYDAKNIIEALQTRLHRPDGFPLMRWVQPQVVIRLKENGYEVLHGDVNIPPPQEHTASAEPLHLQPRMSRTAYLQALEQVRYHLQRGDIYEVNYCQEFFAHQQLDQPLVRFSRLESLTQAPFAAYVQYGSRFILCASPERFLQKQGNTLRTQPIKGTIKRSGNSAEDMALKTSLANSEKDRAENVMIVDLVRNDLSRLANPGSVEVEELFGVHTFATVHHMISTVRCTLRDHISLSDILRATFPMGSMTGAPKVSAMSIADQLETSPRGMYSGSIGYKTPEGDFDFNVVIRSIVADNTQPYTSVKVGGAITMQSDAKREYEECLLKADAVLRALQNQPVSTH